MENKYKGLSNMGATCYMNSVLQTLFMTPQFRQIIYEWKYDKNIHPKESDSILYQLQKLFSKLQMNFPGSTTTKQLAKSFQWEESDAHIQQDIQEFNRVLFQALEKSLVKNHCETAEILKDQFQGSMVHFTKCLVCGYQSVREQVFQDLILTIKNVYEKVYNNNILLALQRYMKPQKLDADNLFECEACQVKVQVERGVRFLKMPKLLNIMFQRFNFDYETFQRQKINDFVEFPFVLNFNHYMQGYDLIPNKLDEDSQAYFVTQNNNQTQKRKPLAPALRKTTTTFKKSNFKKSNEPSIAGKIKTKPLPETKSFLKQIRKKRNNEDHYQDLIYISGKSNSTVLSKKAQSLAQNIHDRLHDDRENKSEGIQDYEKISSKEGSKKDVILEESPNKMINEDQNKKQITGLLLLPPPPPLSLPPTGFSQPYNVTMEEVKTQTIQQQLQKLMNSKKTLNDEKQKRLEELEKENQQLVSKSLKDGPLVYELYSVMIHNGSATQGHYYSYIKSFEDGRWYCFNDQRVSEVNVMEISKAFGGNGTTSNAYALYYRLAGSQKNIKKEKMVIPDYIRRVVEQEETTMKMLENEKIMNIDNLIVLKIHYQLYVKQLEMYKTQSLRVCLEKAKQLFNIGQTVKQQNIRLRMYNPVSDMKLDTYLGKEDLSLQELKINSYRSMLLETKSDNQVFEEFQAGFMSIRLAFWENCEGNITSLCETNLKLHKASVNRFGNALTLENVIKEIRSNVLGVQENEKLCIVKRHINDQHSYHQVLNIQINLEKTLQDLGVFQGQILFIQKEGDNMLWAREFENELFRINIKYNLPQESGNELFNILTDSRKTLFQLKQQICGILMQEPQSIIIKRGNKSGMELKNTSLSLKQLKFINGTQLHLEKGIAAKLGQIRVHLYFAQDASVQSINKLHDFEYIADIPINSSHKASQVKEVFAKWVKKLRGLQLQNDQFRIRQKVSNKIGKIYRQKPMKQQQLIQKRQIAIELKQDKIDIKDFALYVRYWNEEDWTLSQKYQFIVNKNTTMIDLAKQIQQKVKQIEIEKMNICRVLSIHKFSMLDLVEMEYFEISDVSVIGEPLFVNSDGLLYIVKDGSKQPRNLTQEEEKKFGGTLKVIQKAKNNKSVGIKKEKGVTIRVVEKQQEKQITQKKNQQ